MHFPDRFASVMRGRLLEVSFSFPLQTGTWFAGVSLPFFVSQGAVESAGEKIGFEGFSWHDRTDALPPIVLPNSDPSYSDDWDEWLSARYEGPSKTATVPQRPAWLFFLPDQPAAVAAPSSSQAQGRYWVMPKQIQSSEVPAPLNSYLLVQGVSSAIIESYKFRAGDFAGVQDRVNALLTRYPSVYLARVVGDANSLLQPRLSILDVISL
jgi:hypothetical protein